MEWHDRPNIARTQLADKLIDWQALAAAGGEGLIVHRRVLDLGPCYGLEAFYWGRLAARYVAVDADGFVLEWLHQIPRVEVFNGNVLALSFANASFDLILDFSTLDNTTNPIQGYGEARRMMAPGAKLVTTFANGLVLGSREGQVTLLPHELKAQLEAMGLLVELTGNWHQPRAYMVATLPEGVAG